MNPFEDVGKEKFHIKKSHSLKNLQDLMDSLPIMTDEQFAHHVTKTKNDFATWAEHLGAPQEIVELIRSAHTRDALRQALLHARDGIHQPIDEDDLFTRMRDEYTEKNDKMLDKFDDLATKMQEALDNEMPKELEKLEDELRDRYEDLRTKISDLRRARKDMLIASLTVRPFSAKLAFAHATREKKDYEQARAVLDGTEREIKEAEQQEEVNVKKEVLAMAGEGLKTAETDDHKR